MPIYYSLDPPMLATMEIYIYYMVQKFKIEMKWAYMLYHRPLTLFKRERERTFIHILHLRVSYPFCISSLMDLLRL